MLATFYYLELVVEQTSYPDLESLLERIRELLDSALKFAEVSEYAETYLHIISKLSVPIIVTVATGGATAGVLAKKLAVTALTHVFFQTFFADLETLLTRQIKWALEQYRDAVKLKLELLRKPERATGDTVWEYFLAEFWLYIQQDLLATASELYKYRGSVGHTALMIGKDVFVSSLSELAKAGLEKILTAPLNPSEQEKLVDAILRFVYDNDVDTFKNLVIGWAGRFGLTVGQAEAVSKAFAKIGEAMLTILSAANISNKDKIITGLLASISSKYNVEVPQDIMEQAVGIDQFIMLLRELYGLRGRKQEVKELLNNIPSFGPLVANVQRAVGALEATIEHAMAWKDFQEMLLRSR